jgi:selenocysteine lyase/cysteine desulfurase
MKLKLYMDYTASGQELKFIVNQITKIEENYANVHTETTFTSWFMNQLIR